MRGRNEKTYNDTSADTGGKANEQIDGQEEEGKKGAHAHVIQCWAFVERNDFVRAVRLLIEWRAYEEETSC